MSFNLIDEPFIPCLDMQGMPCELSLRDTLLRASDLRELRDDSPLVTVALHRLLLAILHRNFGPVSLTKWKELWSRGRFDDAVLTNYFEQWHERFDLFHPERPFFQVAEINVTKRSPSQRMAIECNRENGATLFDHSMYLFPIAMKSNEVAKYLIAEQSYALAGGNAPKGFERATNAPLAGGAAVLVQGETLFATLMLNLVPQEPTKEADLPAWERVASPCSDSSFPSGYSDYFTWQSRSIRLLRDNDGLVRELLHAPGRTLDTPAPYFDPHVAYRLDPKLGVRAISLTKRKDTWRNSAALLQFADNDQFKAPDNIRTLATLGSTAIPRGQRYQLLVLGFCNETENAKVEFWRRDRLPLPAAFLNDRDLVEKLQNAIGHADEVGRHVRMAAWKTASTLLSNGQTSPDKARVAALVDSFSPDRLYWSRLEVPFRELLVDLPGESEGDTEHQEVAVARWVCDTLKPQARAAFDETVGSLNQTGREHHAVTLGREQLEKDLSSVTKPHQEKLNEVATVHRA
ncbi:MAG: type I-E CRISPR-associated protein Cse1/CasA [Planctomycetia bacterium]|nr:type I-E CRISPR-associated protein Cse1/CasA [Planctomycetia bacterium]